jgi:hypothetical protein
MPPPELPNPPVKAFAVPTMFLSKNPVLQTWHGTNVAPKMPIKNRRTIKPVASLMAKAKAVGIAPAMRVLAKTHRGPNLSHKGPQIIRTTRVAARARMLEFAISFWLKCRSALMVLVMRGDQAYLVVTVIRIHVRGLRPYQDMKATMNPHQEKKKTRPYTLNGFKAGIDLAFLLIGLSSGALKRIRGSKAILGNHDDQFFK